MPSFRSVIETLKERLPKKQGQRLVEYQNGVERRLERPVDAGEQKPAATGGS